MSAPILPSGLVSSELEKEYNIAATRYDLGQQRAREAFADFADALPTARDLASIVERIRASGPPAAQFGGPPRLSDLVDALGPAAAGIYLVPGSYTVEDKGGSNGARRLPGAAIILRRDGSTESIQLPELTANGVAENASKLLRHNAAAAEVCAWLWKVVAQPLLAAATKEGSVLRGVEDWVLVPTGHVNSLPLHAAGSTQTGWIDDHVCVRVAPSLLALVGDAGTKAPPCEGPPVVAVTSAADLAFLPADRAVAAALLDNAAPFVGDITSDELLHALVEAPTAVISGHAVHSLTEGGALALSLPTGGSGGAAVDQWLTATDVDRLPLRRRDLIFLSACSSGQVATDLPDEAIGLPASFLHSGYQSVIATVWPVRDTIAFMTLARYLQLRTEHPGDASADRLRKVRTWLRTTTATGFLAWLDDLTANVALPETPVS